MFVNVHAGVGGDVLGADDFTVSLESVELEELGSRQKLWNREIVNVPKASKHQVYDTQVQSLN